MALAIGPHIAKALQFRQSYLCKTIALNSEKIRINAYFFALYHAMRVIKSKATNQAY
jgi:hypothetical protein